MNAKIKLMQTEADYETALLKIESLLSAFCIDKTVQNLKKFFNAHQDEAGTA